jgi:hypothetical protein
LSRLPLLLSRLTHVIPVFLIVLLYKRGFRLAGKCDASRTAMRLGIFMLQAIISIMCVPFSDPEYLPFITTGRVILIIVISDPGVANLDLIIAVREFDYSKIHPISNLIRIGILQNHQ